MSFLGRKGFTLLPSPNAISPSGSVHDKLELELGSEIKRNIAKCQICHTLPERSVGTSYWRPKII
jgi:hypothetical protein